MKLVGDWHALTQRNGVLGLKTWTFFSLELDLANILEDKLPHR